MIRLSQAAKALGAQLVGPDIEFMSVSTDSRMIKAGDLFIALRGENFDGYAYVAQSLQGGAVAAMVNKDSYRGSGSAAAGMQSHVTNPNPDARSPTLVVEDTRLALGKLAAYWRGRFDIPLVAITGSNGKTTVKEMLAAILRNATGDEESVLATKGNFNNDIGMPLTLLKLHASHCYAVIEMGMSHAGEIDYLTRLAKPQVVIVNNASGAHLQGLGSVEAVARAKGEIFAGLDKSGIAVINADDAHAGLWRDLASGHQVLDFSLQHEAALQGFWTAQDYGGLLQAQTPAGELRVVLQVPGVHNARNALAAATAALALHIPLPVIIQALADFSGVSGRLQRKQAVRGATLIDDTYNANPASMRAALEVLAQATGKRIFVLGDMGELGEEAAKFHREIGHLARTLGIERLLALGELSAGAVHAFGSGAEHYASVEALCASLDKELDARTIILVKGSRFMKMERVVTHCAGTVKVEAAKGAELGGSTPPFTLPCSPEKEFH